MAMRLRLALILALAAGPGAAETAVDCARMPDLLRDLSGLAVTAPPAASAEDWCVLDGARLGPDGGPRITAAQLRARATADGPEILSLALEARGLRLAPDPRDPGMPDWLRDLLRLQSGDLRLMLRREVEADRLLLDLARLDLSGGTMLELSGALAGAGIAPRTLPSGRLRQVRLVWRSDGSTLRPVLAAWGARLKPGLAEGAAVEAARAALLALAAAVPAGALGEVARKELESAIRALPQGRGRLTVDLASEGGIGAADLGLLALLRDPSGSDALAQFLAGSRLDIDWQPGILP
ncbi:hypothetical protein [Rhodobacter calidifons]|uniref:Uncharacterized protein n=1 Tax=Rhodobacter calidifons TaxID=2715277 RepID=A0ABX0G766_9RHOB|nr:hypothetical protein [Rhodobacter calidifons]NHB76694.1 hypothetical protein [Rhodobacter calidifons]